MNIFVCDDMPHEHDIIRHILDEYSTQHGIEFNVTDYGNPLEMLAEIESGTQCDLILLDIEMPEMSGLDVAQKILNRRSIIFVTHRDDLAFKAAATLPYGMIQKSEIEASLKLYLSMYTKDLAPKDISIKVGKEVVVLPVSEIIYIQSAGHNLNFICNNNTYVSRGKIDVFEQQLSLNGFIRTHQRNLVNPAYVSVFNSAELILILKDRNDNKHNVPVSRGQKDIVTNNFAKGLTTALKYI